MGSFLLVFATVTICCVGYVTSFEVARLSRTWQSISTSNKDTINGGRNASKEEFPHQVLLLDKDQTFCGAFIVSENYVLTAAHCLNLSQTPSAVILYAGSTCPFEANSSTEILASELKVHPDYSPDTNDNDVGIIKTAKSIQFSKTVQPIKLPPEGRAMVDDSIITVSGWGVTEEGGNASRCLLAVDVPVINLSICQKDYTEIVNITANMFCGGNEENGGKGPCPGDSGGAAVQDGMAVGIVSFSNGCAQPHYPAGYTNVASPSVRKFIKEVTGL